jgi:hypothetical protein
VNRNDLVSKVVASNDFAVELEFQQDLMRTHRAAGSNSEHTQNHVMIEFQKHHHPRPTQADVSSMTRTCAADSVMIHAPCSLLSTTIERDGEVMFCSS